MRDLQAKEDFLQSGGSERAVMSTTSDPEVAIRYGLSKNSLIFKIVASDFMARGASIKYLSAFPGEAEYETLLRKLETYFKRLESSDVTLGMHQNLVPCRLAHGIPVALEDRSASPSSTNRTWSSTDRM